MGLAQGIQLEDYRKLAVDRTATAVSALAELGVKALVTGSLARGKFGVHSDVDLLITDCPRHLKYAIEGRVEDILDGIPFDVIYLDELPACKVGRFKDGAVDASQLR